MALFETQVTELEVGDPGLMRLASRHCLSWIKILDFKIFSARGCETMALEGNMARLGPGPELLYSQVMFIDCMHHQFSS